MNSHLVFLQIEVFYIKLQNGEYDHPLFLAKGLEDLSNQAWDLVDELYPLPVAKTEPGE